MEQSYCPNCNAALESNAAFCHNCGNPVNAVDQQPQNDQPQYTQPQNAQPQYTQPQYTQPQYAQPQYAQPQYTQPQYAQPQYGYNQQPYVAPVGNGLGTAGMVLGIVSAAMLLLSFIPVVGLFFLVICITLAVPGMGLSIAGMCRHNLPKGRAIAGLVLNTFGFIIAICLALA